MTAFLDAHFVVRRANFTLDVELAAEPGDVVAVIGPNGSGKSTLVRTLAGLVPVSQGRIRCRGLEWDSGNGSPTGVQQRNVGMVFQEQLLFPHISVLGNVAFGPRSRGAAKNRSHEIAQAWLDRLGVGDLATRRPKLLSGGQAQRVAIARALATEPSVLLLDEPLAALDVGVAMALRFELARHLADFGGVSVLVTHDAIDTMTVANRVVVLDGGRVAQMGTPADVAQRPRTEHVARLVGLNALRGRSNGTDVRLLDGSSLVSTTTFHGEVFASFSPTAVTLTADEPTGSARNRWRGSVRSVVPHGAAVRVHLDAGKPLIADVTPTSAAELSLTPGRTVWAAVKATEVAIYGAAAVPPARLPSLHV
ncbi:MAG: ABC transporter ATP-binding protein [Actinomycetota bacterium]|nr:ABC transporter ATP-binding protein [Actinomycetota bacterium]MDQ3615991.1 ABC transporter ATP-binding protein [Actinomycetota bacterium]